jgi:hypothetical protein
MDNSPNHHIADNDLSTASSGANFAVVRSSGASSTGSSVFNNRIRKGTGGNYLDNVSSGTMISRLNLLDGYVETLAALTVATLPAAGGWQGPYTRHTVTDANATTFNSIVAGGGANVVPVFSDGTNWRIG